MNQAIKFPFTNKDNCNIYEWILLIKAMLGTLFLMLYKMKFFKKSQADDRRQLYKFC